MRFLLIGCVCLAAAAQDGPFQVSEDGEQIQISGSSISAAVRKRGYVSGVAAGSFVDKKTGFHDAGFGLDIADWLMEPGSDQAYRDKLDPELVYAYNNAVHGKRAKRSIEGLQICTQSQGALAAGDTGQGLRGGAHGLPLQDRGAGQEDGVGVDADDRVPGGQAVFPLERPGGPR